MRRLAIFGVCAWVAGLAMIAYAANAGGGGGGSHAMTAHGPSQPTGGTTGGTGVSDKATKGNPRPFLVFTFKSVAVKTVSAKKAAPRKGPDLTTNSGSKIAQ
jgi:hypothetical protein